MLVEDQTSTELIHRLLGISNVKLIAFDLKP